MSETNSLSVLGRTFTSTTTGLFKDGLWGVTSSMEEKRTTDGETWEEKKIVAKCTDDSFASAYNVAIQSIVEQFNDILNVNQSRSLFSDNIPNATKEK